MKKIGLASATAVGLGAIIGAGVFVLSGTAIALAGSFALVAFLMVGMVALIMALVFGELCSLMPNAKGASYSYAYAAFGSEMGFLTGILAYFSYATAIAAIGLGFGSYLSSMLGIGAAIAPQLFAVLLIFALAAVNLMGIRKAAKADFSLVLVKLLILAIFIVFSIMFMFKTSSFAYVSFNPSDLNISSIFDASVAIFFAYAGFQTITTFGSRIKGGSRSAAKAMLAAVIISIAVYALVVASLLVLVPTKSYQITADPLAFALGAAGAPYALILLVDIGALVATASAALAMMLSASRISYQISSDKLLPKALRKFDKRRDVAVNGVMLSAVIGVVALFSGNIYEIAAISNFGILFAYIMACLALMHFRKSGRKADIKMPGYPYLPIIAIVTMLAFISGMPRVALTVGVVMVFSIIAAYYLLREIKDKKVIRIRLFD
jgi:basic amino acid/polyamine antiporter, APA family